jgi:hypothetical protein
MSCVEQHGGRIAAALNAVLADWRRRGQAFFPAHDALGHMREPIHKMQELHRCLAPQGWLLSPPPNTDGRGAFQDPTHVSIWYYTRTD